MAELYNSDATPEPEVKGFAGKTGKTSFLKIRRQSDVEKAGHRGSYPMGKLFQADGDSNKMLKVTPIKGDDQKVRIETYYRKAPLNTTLEPIK